MSVLDLVILREVIDSEWTSMPPQDRERVRASLDRLARLFPSQPNPAEVVTVPEPRNEPQVCHRCDVEMPDDGEWFICPCCRTRTRGRERQSAIYEAHMAELGMTVEEYSAYCKTLVRRPTEKDMEQAQEFAERMAQEWVPSCEHDTTNPWALVKS